MNLTSRQGKKNNNPLDRIIIQICPKCGREEALLLRDWLNWGRMKGQIEDLHYPLEKGFRGRYKLSDFLIDGLKKINGNYAYTVEEVCRIHKIPERE